MKRVNASLADKNDHKGLIPDETDRKNIANLIEMYEKAFPYPHPLSIKFQMDDARKTIKQERKLHSLKEKTKGIDLKRLTSIPTPLHGQLIQGYPLLFKDKRQTQWFLRHFPVFDLSKR